MNTRTPPMRGLRTLLQVIVAALIVAVPEWLTALNWDPVTYTFATSVVAGALALAQNELDDRRTDAQHRPLDGDSGGF